MVTDHRCGEIDKLVEGIRLATAAVGDPVADLARTIQLMLKTEVDPYLLAGVLIESAVQAVVRRVPEERRTATSLALLQLLADRLRAAGQTLYQPD